MFTTPAWKLLPILIILILTSCFTAPTQPEPAPVSTDTSLADMPNPPPPIASSRDSNPRSAPPRMGGATFVVAAGTGVIGLGAGFFAHATLTACMRAALDHDLVGLGVIASVLSNGKPNEISMDEVLLLSLRKIFVYGAYDFPSVVVDMKKISASAPEPKIVQVYQTYLHGTDIFNTEYGSHFTELLIDFLEALRSDSPPPAP